MPSSVGQRIHQREGEGSSSSSSLLLVVDQQQAPPPVLAATMHQGLVTVLDEQLARIEDAIHRYCEWHTMNEGVLAQIMAEVNRLCASLAPHIQILLPQSSSSSSSTNATERSDQHAAREATGIQRPTQSAAHLDEDQATVLRLMDLLPTVHSCSFATKCETLNSALGVVWRRWCLDGNRHNVVTSPSLVAQQQQRRCRAQQPPTDGGASMITLAQLFLILHECLCCLAPPTGGHEAAAWDHVRARLTFHHQRTTPNGTSANDASTRNDGGRGGSGKGIVPPLYWAATSTTNNNEAGDSVVQQQCLAAVCECLGRHRSGILTALPDLGVETAPTVSDHRRGGGGGSTAGGRDRDLVDAVCDTLCALGSAQREF